MVMVSRELEDADDPSAEDDPEEPAEAEEPAEPAEDDPLALEAEEPEAAPGSKAEEAPPEEATPAVAADDPPEDPEADAESSAEEEPEASPAATSAGEFSSTEPRPSDDAPKLASWDACAPSAETPSPSAGCSKNQAETAMSAAESTATAHATS